MKNSTFQRSAAVHLFLLIATWLISIRNAALIATDYLSIGSGKGSVTIKQGDVIGKLIIGGLILCVLALVLLIRIGSGKKKAGWLIAGNLLTIPFLLLFAAFYYLVANSDKQDVAIQFILLSAMGLASAFLSGAWASEGRISWVLFLLIDAITVINFARTTIHASCPHWRENGHHIYYYSGNRKQQEYTIDCGAYQGESRVWYENSQLEHYIHYDEHGGIDSEIEYYENGYPKYSPHVARLKTNISYTYSQRAPGALERSLRIFDSTINGKAAHFEEEIGYGPLGKPHYRDLRNDSARIRYETVYYDDGTVSYCGAMFFDAHPSATHPEKLMLNTGNWYKYDTSGRLIDSLNMNDSVQSTPQWWER